MEGATGTAAIRPSGRVVAAYRTEKGHEAVETEVVLTRSGDRRPHQLPRIPCPRNLPEGMLKVNIPHQENSRNKGRQTTKVRYSDGTPSPSIAPVRCPSVLPVALPSDFGGFSGTIRFGQRQVVGAIPASGFLVRRQDSHHFQNGGQALGMLDAPPHLQDRVHFPRRDLP